MRFFRPRQAVNVAHLELVNQIHGLVQRIKLVEDDLAALEAKHERLRGRFYGQRGARDQDTRPETKAEILARMGYTRGLAIAPPRGNADGGLQPVQPREDEDG